MHYSFLGSFWMSFLSDCWQSEHMHTVERVQKDTQSLPVVSDDQSKPSHTTQTYVIPVQSTLLVFQTLSTLIHLHYPCKQKQTKQIAQVYTPLSIISTFSVL